MAVEAATINGFLMAYAATGEGPPLVVVRGLELEPLAARARPLIPWWAAELLAPHYTVVTYDARGSGRSQTPDSGYDLLTFVEDLRGLIAHLGLERPHLLGVFGGGPVAIQYAVTYPEEMNLLVLADTAPHLLVDENGATLRQVLAEREARGSDALPDDPPGADAAARAQAARLREQILTLSPDQRRQAFAGWQRTVAAYQDLDLAHLLYAVRVPALQVHGRDDDLVPAMPQYLRGDRIKRGTIRLLSGEGHDVLDRRASGAAQIVLDWLRMMDELIAAGDYAWEWHDPNELPVVGG